MTPTLLYFLFPLPFPSFTSPPSFLSYSSLLSPLCVASVRPSALRSCSTGDSFLSQAFIRSAKSAPVLIHPLHPLLSDSVHTSLADELAGRALYSTPVPVPLSVPVCLSVPPSTHFTSSLTICMFLSVFAYCFYACLCLWFHTACLSWCVWVLLFEDISLRPRLWGYVVFLGCCCFWITI